MIQVPIVQSDEEETEFKRDESDEEEMDSEIKVGSSRRLRSGITLGDEILQLTDSDSAQ